MSNLSRETRGGSDIGSIMSKQRTEERGPAKVTPESLNGNAGTTRETPRSLRGSQTLDMYTGSNEGAPSFYLDTDRTLDENIEREQTGEGSSSRKGRQSAKDIHTDIERVSLTEDDTQIWSRNSRNLTQEEKTELSNATVDSAIEWNERRQRTDDQGQRRASGSIAERLSRHEPSGKPIVV